MDTSELPDDHIDTTKERENQTIIPNGTAGDRTSVFAKRYFDCEGDMVDLQRLVDAAVLAANGVWIMVSHASIRPQDADGLVKLMEDISDLTHRIYDTCYGDDEKLDASLHEFAIHESS